MSRWPKRFEKIPIFYPSTLLNQYASTHVYRLPEHTVIVLVYNISDFQQDMSHHHPLPVKNGSTSPGLHHTSTTQLACGGRRALNGRNVCKNILKMVIAKDHNLNLCSSEARLRFREYYIKMRIFFYIKFKNRALQRNVSMLRNNKKLNKGVN